jgi:phosphatidylglycerol lysyltransferase
MAVTSNREVRPVTNVKAAPAALTATSTGQAAQSFRRLLPYLGALLALALFAGAAFILYHQVTAYRPADVRRAVGALGWGQVALALGAAAASYLLLTVYDVLALRHVGWRLHFRRIALTSFVSYAFSHAFGFGSIVGTSVRYRLYAPFGLTAGEIAEVSAFVNITFMTGLAVIFPAVALLDPSSLAVLGVPTLVSVVFAAVALSLTVGYVLLGWWLKRPLCILRYEVDLPRPGLAVAQIALSVADLALAGAVLYFCLPWGTVAFPHLLGVFVLGLVAGLISHVPGGLGVFDTVVLIGLSDQLPGDVVLAGLLVFRVAYFLLPVILAGALFGTIEVLSARRHFHRMSENLATFVTPAAPLVLAGGTFLGGVVLLFSSAAPIDTARLWIAGSLLPLPLLEASHFLGSVIGILLLLLARGLQRRLRTAWMITVGLLGLGVMSALLKGFDWQEAGLLTILLLALLPARREFTRTSSLLGERYTPGWFLAISTGLLSSFWLGLFCYKHVDLTGEVWWRFALHGDASRFLRASVAVAAIALAVALYRLLTPMRSHRKDASLLAE